MVGKSVEVPTIDLAEPSATQVGYASPTTGTERAFAEVLAGVLGADRVSVDSNFFDDLGTDSLVMAQFCARVRKREDLPSVSMKDIYRNPTIRSLTAALVAAAPAPAGSSVPARIEVPKPASTLEYVLCGALQFLIFLGYSYVTVLVAVRGFEWITAGTGLLDLYLRSVLFGSAGFLYLFAFPILAKWVLMGRWKPQQFRVWSLAYVRFWVVKTLVQRNLMVLLFVGSPLYVLYLRAMGAKVGRGVAIFSRNVPVCTDLLTIGAGTVIRKDSFFACYRAHAGLIQTGPVTLGTDVVVGEVTVIDIETSMGDGAQLGHASSLHSGQVVPAGERWHGSPAQRTDVDYRGVAPTNCGTLRRVCYSVLQLLSLLVLSMPLTIGVLDILLAELPYLAALLNVGPLAFTDSSFYLEALVVSVVLFFGTAIIGLLVVLTVPRVLNIAIRPDKVYPLYGLHYTLHRAIARMTNIKFFAFLFGDSSCIVHYLHWLGYDLSRIEQTGSNFGQRVKHETPYLSSVGSGTMVADGLSIINADFSSTSFRVSRTSIGPRNFLGNNIAYPSQGRTGDNCLIGTKAMVPIDGEIRQGVGLLGSPSFEIPRTVQRDSKFELGSRDELRRRLIAKNKHNAVTMGLYLLVRWIYAFVVTVVLSIAVTIYPAFGALAIPLVNVVILLLSVVYFVLVERAVAGLQALKPSGCSMYDLSFWRHERFWKVPAVAYLQAFNGTPFKSMLWRALGVRIGSKVFDDGCGLVEKTFVTIGDNCTLNAGSIIQCHSQEDGAFKSDRIRIGAGCTLGVGAFVHYGVAMGDGAVLALDSFLMKGEEVPQRAQWGGNPARETSVAAVGEGNNSMGILA
jgi:non-ribosomal peptide synthetase-like protein